MNGLELARSYFFEAVQPIIEDDLPDLNYGAGLIGPGSEVLGFDTEMSRDHDWGPRVQIFLEKGSESVKPELLSALAEKLPGTFHGFETAFSPTDGDDAGHRVEIETVAQFFIRYLGIDPDSVIAPMDWLSMPFQKLKAVTSGEIFQDGVGLEQIRSLLGFYPRDIRLYIMACAWRRIGQEEHLAGRAGHNGDELGAAIIVSRIVRDLMRICFLLERQYPPYPKWFGAAFAKLESAESVGPHLLEVVRQNSWMDKERALGDAYRKVLKLHNRLKITDPVSTKLRPFFTRPYNVIDGGRVADLLVKEISAPEVARLNSRQIGNIDLLSDNTDFLEPVEFRAGFKRLLA